MKKKIFAIMMATLMSATIFASMATVSSEEEALTGQEIEEILKMDASKSFKPDMRVLSQMCISNDGGQTWKVRGTIKNGGTGYAIAHHTYFFEDFGEPGQDCLGSYYHGFGFEAGATKYAWSRLFSASGPTLITTYADYRDWVSESNENNNELTQTINL